MLAAEHFIIASLINKFGKCPVSTDGGGEHGIHPQACQFLDVEHHIISIPHLRKALLLKEQSNPIYQR
jgi:hypothetical protein